MKTKLNHQKPRLKCTVHLFVKKHAPTVVLVLWKNHYLVSLARHIAHLICEFFLDITVMIMHILRLVLKTAGD